MHFETKGLPEDTREVFFSDIYYYAASAMTSRNGKPVHVGCGRTKADAIEDMRRSARTVTRHTAGGIEQRLTLDESQKQHLGATLRALRADRGLSQIQVANRALGFMKSHAKISRLELGQLCNIEASTVQALAFFFQVPLETLLTPAASTLSAAE